MLCGARHAWRRAARKVQPHTAPPAERLRVAPLLLIDLSYSQNRRNLSTSVSTNDGRFWRRLVAALILTAAGGTALVVVSPQHEPSRHSVSTLQHLHDASEQHLALVQDTPTLGEYMLYLATCAIAVDDVVEQTSHEVLRVLKAHAASGQDADVAVARLMEILQHTRSRKTQEAIDKVRYKCQTLLRVALYSASRCRIVPGAKYCQDERRTNTLCGKRVRRHQPCGEVAPSRQCLDIVRSSGRDVGR